VGVEIRVEGLTKSFGSHVIWSDVTLTLPAGEISVMLGPVRDRQVRVPQDPGRIAQAREGLDLDQ
jgi:hypothetical protein